MSIRLYLGDAVCAAFAERTIGLTPSASMTFEGVPVKTDEDCRPYYDVRNEKAPKQTLVPYPLRGHVDCVSWWTTLPENCQTRQPGKYTCETAEAIVEPHPQYLCLQARIYGPELDDIYQLHNQLRTGLAFLSERWEDAPPPEQSPTEAAPPPASTRMKITCPTCQKIYTVDEHKIAGKTVRMTCRECRSIILITPDGCVSVQSTSDGGAAPVMN